MSDCADEQSDPTDEEEFEDDERLLNSRSYIQTLVAECQIPISQFDELPPSQQRLLYQLLDDYPSRKVFAAISAEAPFGWGIQTSRTSLLRFKDRYKEKLKAQSAAETKAVQATLPPPPPRKLNPAEIVLANPDATDEDYSETSERMLRLRLLEILRDSQTSIPDICHLFRIHNRLRSIDLDRLKLRIKRGDENTSAHPADVNRFDAQTHSV